MAVPSLKPVLLLIRDGWGENHNSAHDAYNAVKLARTPVCSALSKEWPRTEILACGPDVGLPEGVMGNSEVGHQNIGAGRIVDQEIIRIDKAINEDAFRDNDVLKSAFSRASKGALHLIGLASDAGVHSMLPHLYGLLRHAKAAGIERVFLHLLMDGRDAPPKSGVGYIREVEAQCAAIGVGVVATVAGRFWAMDRDHRWDRVEKAYNCLTDNGDEAIPTALSAEAAVQGYYDNPLDSSRDSDEFVVPTRICSGDGKPLGLVSDGDAVIFFNFRGDRPRELTRAFIDDAFDAFPRSHKLDVYYATLTDYQKGLCPNVLFPKPPKMRNVLGMLVADKGIAQFRCAETEKYPHVTFFFNDYRDEPFPGEDRVMIPSPQDVPTYDSKPEMSAAGICDAAEKAILSGRYGLLVVNFANPDMVGHTGSLKAAIAAVEIVDTCVGRLVAAIEKMDGRALITADHGNADQMWNPDVDAPHTQHTLNPVEVLVLGREMKGRTLRPAGRLADIAPTLLQMMELPQPREMTGQSLIAD